MKTTPETILAYTDALMKTALHKCDRIGDAEDLVSETILAALTALARGVELAEPEIWLFSVMKRRHCALLRRKYRHVTVSIGEGFDLPCDGEIDDRLIAAETAEAVRRQVAFLAKTYRETLVRYYFRGEGVAVIADALGIPAGTVKSRLDVGRKQVRKGLEEMETYTEYSYSPKRLYVRNSGTCGRNLEPMTTVEDDVLGQNLLILAYDKPVTIPELSRAIGVSCAYVEPAVHKLVREELMKETGDGRVYTDFIIYRQEDHWRYNHDKVQFVRENRDAYLDEIRAVIRKMRETDFYSERLERFVLIDIACAATWNAGEPYRNVKQVFPDRPNGGKWIAFGTIEEDGVTVPDNMKTPENYGMGGIRRTHLPTYCGGDDLTMFNYDTALNPGGFGKFYSFGNQTFMENEEAFLQLAYLVKHGIDPVTVAYPPRFLAAIDGLCEEGFFARGDSGLHLLCPCLTHNEAEFLFAEITRPAASRIAERLTEPLGVYLRTHRQPLPAHLHSVPDQKRTMPHEPPAMAFVFEAIREGLHPRDLGICPETLLIFD